MQGSLDSFGIHLLLELFTEVKETVYRLTHLLQKDTTQKEPKGREVQGKI